MRRLCATSELSSFDGRQRHRYLPPRPGWKLTVQISPPSAHMHTRIHASTHMHTHTWICTHAHTHTADQSLRGKLEMHTSACLLFFPLCFLLATISPRLRRAAVSPVISCIEACGGRTWVGKQAQSWRVLEPAVPSTSDGVLVLQLLVMLGTFLQTLS